MSQFSSFPYRITRQMNEEKQQPERVFIFADAAELIVLRILLRQAIQMLKRPEDYAKDRKKMSAHTIDLALDGMDAGIENDL